MQDEDDAGPELGLDLGAPPVADAAYKVLARKYRPASFDALIGQDAMVRTLRNAFTAGRIAHGFILTGVRGVGKTTTARIIAKGLNCVGPDGLSKAPTVEPCGVCEPCRSITASRNIDVLEMDAASHTGIDDVREIIDGSRYAAVAARYKVYIIDEVHMLSKNAFNGLLKTLEEPPPHVVFIFATTEIRKVPVTVLSRCQRFDLKRVDAGILMDHLAAIARTEGAQAERGALALIARAAEGSVRDALSLLDQALSHAQGAVREDAVRDMLGLVDRTRLIDLFEAVMAGDTASALREFAVQYEQGADPLVIMQDLLGFAHFITRLKLVPGLRDDASVSESEGARGRALAETLPVNVLTRAFSMLLKGIVEVRDAPDPQAAAEMVLVKIAFAADLPTPDEALRLLKARPGDGARTGTPAPRQQSAGNPRGSGERSSALAVHAQPQSDPQPMPQTAPVAQSEPVLADFEAVVARARETRDVLLQTQLEDHVHLVRFEQGRIEIRPGPRAPRDLAGRLSERLAHWTGKRWSVLIVQDEGAPTLSEQRRRIEDARHLDATRDPTVAALLAAFPGAQITAIRDLVDVAPALAEDAGYIPDLDAEQDEDD